MAYLSLLGAALFISARTFLLTMSASWIYSILMAANFLIALASLMGELYSRNRTLGQFRNQYFTQYLRMMLHLESRTSRLSHLRQRLYWLPSALWALYMLITGGIMVALSMRPHGPSPLSSPYPEIAILMLALSVLWFSFTFYRLLCRRVWYLQAIREGQ